MSLDLSEKFSIVIAIILQVIDSSEDSERSRGHERKDPNDDDVSKGNFSNMDRVAGRGLNRRTHWCHADGSKSFNREYHECKNRCTSCCLWNK